MSLVMNRIVVLVHNVIARKKLLKIGATRPVFIETSRFLK